MPFYKMRAAFVFALALAGSVLGLPAVQKRGGPGYTIAHPGGIQDIILTKDNTVNGTQGDAAQPFSILGTKSLPLNLVNNFSGGAVNCYITGLDANNKVVLVGPQRPVCLPECKGFSRSCPHHR